MQPMPKLYVRGWILAGVAFTSVSAASGFEWASVDNADAIAANLGAAIGGCAIGYLLAYAVWQHRHKSG